MCLRDHKWAASAQGASSHPPQEQQRLHNPRTVDKHTLLRTKVVSTPRANALTRLLMQVLMVKKQSTPTTAPGSLRRHSSAETEIQRDQPVRAIKHGTASTATATRSPRALQGNARKQGASCRRTAQWHSSGHASKKTKYGEITAHSITVRPTKENARGNNRPQPEACKRHTYRPLGTWTHQVRSAHYRATHAHSQPDNAGGLTGITGHRLRNNRPKPERQQVIT